MLATKMTQSKQIKVVPNDFARSLPQTPFIRKEKPNLTPVKKNDICANQNKLRFFCG